MICIKDNVRTLQKSPIITKNKLATKYRSKFSSDRKKYLNPRTKMIIDKMLEFHQLGSEGDIMYMQSITFI